MTREPYVAGQFYEADPEKLKEQIKECFLHKKGPGKLPEGKGNKVKAIISPHAGYMFSGPCQAFGFKEIAEADQPDVFLILGTGHAVPTTCLSTDNFKTPLGVVKTDKDLCEELIKKGIEKDNEAHHSEHSIEVQLPFLQYLFKDFKIVPIIIGQEDYKVIADRIKRAIKGKNVCIIVSSDFTHFGANYGYFPFKENIKENLYKLDRKAIEFIEKNDAKGFLYYCDETGATICGKQAIAVMLEIIEGKIKLLQYYTSSDIIGDYGSAVGYASIVVK